MLFATFLTQKSAILAKTLTLSLALIFRYALLDRIAQPPTRFLIYQFLAPFFQKRIKLVADSLCRGRYQVLAHCLAEPIYYLLVSYWVGFRRLRLLTIGVMPTVPPTHNWDTDEP